MKKGIYLAHVVGEFTNTDLYDYEDEARAAAARLAQGELVVGEGDPTFPRKVYVMQAIGEVVAPRVIYRKIK